MTTIDDTEAAGRAALVRSLFDAFLAGDAEGPAAVWRDDATYTAVTPPLGPLTLTKQQYWQEMLPQALAEMPGYSLEVSGVEAFGPLVVVHLRSCWDADGSAQGIMIFRLVGSEVAEVWAIHGDGRDATTHF